MFDIDSERFLRIYANFENKRKGSQLRKLAEEQNELNTALLLNEYGLNPIDDVIQELADNFILMYQFVYAKDIDIEQLKKAIIEKLDRTDTRIVVGYYD